MPKKPKMNVFNEKTKAREKAKLKSHPARTSATKKTAAKTTTKKTAVKSAPKRPSTIANREVELDQKIEQIAKKVMTTTQKPRRAQKSANTPQVLTGAIQGAYDVLSDPAVKKRLKEYCERYELDPEWVLERGAKLMISLGPISAGNPIRLLDVFLEKLEQGFIHPDTAKRAFDMAKSEIFEIIEIAKRQKEQFAARL